MVQEIPHRNRPIQELIKDELVNGVWPQFVKPTPLNDKYFLVAAKLDPQSLWGLYLVDIYDNVTCLMQAEGEGYISPILVKETKTPPAIPDSVKLNEKEATISVSYTHLADVLNVLEINTREVTSTELNPGRTESNINKGEKYFNDASHCFQNWQSCNGCHPGDARTDGMNWDLMNDGVGNSENCKSLLFSQVTPPNMISGIRASAEVAVRAG